MNDLISRKALLEVAEHNVEFQEGIVDVYILESILAGMSVVDAVPVVHGQWTELHEENGHEVGTCSHCRHVRIIDNYCPNCGAKMDGGNDNDWPKSDCHTHGLEDDGGDRSKGSV